MNYLGEILALAAPISWSVAVILYRKSGQIVPASTLNLFKNVLATSLFLLTMLLLGQDLRVVPAGASVPLLLVSGALGMGLADAFFFMTINRVGAGLQAIINTSYSPAIILLSLLFLDERLTLAQWIGILMILSAVLTVSLFKDSRHGLSRATIWKGVACGLSANAAQAVSVVMIKPMLDETPLLWANTWRIMGGLLASAALLVFWPAQRRGHATIWRPDALRVAVPATLIGTYLTLFFWLGGMKYTQASTASALNQTASLWTFVLAALILHEPVTRARLIGLAVGISGVAFVTLG